MLAILLSNMVRAFFMGEPVYRPSCPRKVSPEGDTDGVFVCVLEAIASPASEQGTHLHLAIFIGRRRIPAALQDNGDSREPSKNRKKEWGTGRDRTDDLLLAKPLKFLDIPLNSLESYHFGYQRGWHSEPA